MRSAKYPLALLLGLVAVMVVQVDAQVPSTKRTPSTLKAGIVAATKEKSERVDKILKAIGAALVEQIRAGRQVEIEGLGTFRVVQVAEHRDLVGGRPATIAAKNFIEFAPASAVEAAANASGAVPARTVPGYDFRINPNADPGIRTPATRNPGTRTR